MIHLATVALVPPPTPPLSLSLSLSLCLRESVCVRVCARVCVCVCVCVCVALHCHLPLFVSQLLIADTFVPTISTGISKHPTITHSLAAIVFTKFYATWSSCPSVRRLLVCLFPVSLSSLRSAKPLPQMTPQQRPDL